MRNKFSNARANASLEYKSGHSLIYTLLVGLCIYVLVRWIAPLMLAMCMVGAM
jgi:hypothetical protein